MNQLRTPFIVTEFIVAYCSWLFLLVVAFLGIKELLLFILTEAKFRSIYLILISINGV